MDDFHQWEAEYDKLMMRLELVWYLGPVDVHPRDWIGYFWNIWHRCFSTVETWRPASIKFTQKRCRRGHVFSLARWGLAGMKRDRLRQHKIVQGLCHLSHCWMTMKIDTDIRIYRGWMNGNRGCSNAMAIACLSFQRIPHDGDARKWWVSVLSNQC